MNMEQNSYEVLSYFVYLVFFIPIWAHRFGTGSIFSHGGNNALSTTEHVTCDHEGDESANQHENKDNHEAFVCGVGSNVSSSSVG
eukprot:m.63608 g.63608  ORF g.63608 m.63608 type:complete len:85 (+) comp23307_c0_seq1:200-454(+)